jgi:hypothetical protein
MTLARAAALGTSPRSRLGSWLPRLAVVALAAVAGAASAADPPPLLRLATLPERPPGAITGSQFARRTQGLPEVERQREALFELERGNVPPALRELRPVELRYAPASGDVVQATIWVTPDYLAVGPKDDFLYAPLTAPSAMAIAERLDCVLPTRRMVDAIYREAAVHLAPQPLPAGPRMRSSAYLLHHQELIDAQRPAGPLDLLVSGHKKDLVLTRRLLAHPDRVAIYGWHRPDGRPIQPLSTVHGAGYVDYSHGVRLVWHEVWVDGRPRSIYDVLADPALAPVLSDEGPIRDARNLLDPHRPVLAQAAALTAAASGAHLAGR